MIYPKDSYSPEEADEIKQWINNRRNSGDFKYPHCDSAILHAPGDCVFCDAYPDAQQQRITLSVNFTGEHDPNKDTCPSELARPLETINKWGGNRPVPIKKGI